MTQQHPLTTLSAAELPGWIAMGRRTTEMLSRLEESVRLYLTSTTALPLENLRQQIENETWIAMGRRTTEMLSRLEESVRLYLTSTTALPLENLRQQIENETAIAEGLLLNADANYAKAIKGRYVLAGGDHDESYDSLHDLLMENNAGWYTPLEYTRPGWPSSRWIVRFPIDEDGDWESETFATLLEATAFCCAADEEHERQQKGLAEAVDQGSATMSQAPSATRAAPEDEPTPAAPLRPVGVWTVERLELLHRDWPNQELSAGTILARINELAGHPCGSEAAVRQKASSLGLRREPPPEAVAQRAKEMAPAPSQPRGRSIPPPTARDADPADLGDFTTEDMHEARAMLDKGADGRGLHEYFGGELSFWSAFATNYREQKKEAA